MYYVSVDIYLLKNARKENSIKNAILNSFLISLLLTSIDHYLYLYKKGKSLEGGEEPQKERRKCTQR
jgi:hypothetical protein